MSSTWQEPRDIVPGNYDFRPEIIGKHYKARLQEIWEKHAEQKPSRQPAVNEMI